MQDAAAAGDGDSVDRIDMARRNFENDPADVLPRPCRGEQPSRRTQLALCRHAVSRSCCAARDSATRPPRRRPRAACPYKTSRRRGGRPTATGIERLPLRLDRCRAPSRLLSSTCRILHPPLAAFWSMKWALSNKLLRRERRGPIRS